MMWSIPNANCPRDWPLNREVRFTWRQQGTRQWISFREIAEWLLDLDGRDGCTILQRDLLGGDFEEDGRSKVLYLHHRSTMVRMTRQCLNDVIDIFPPDIVCLEYLARCWIPRRMFVSWLAKHELPRAPARFEPRKKVRKPASARDEAAAIRELAEHFKINPLITRKDAEALCRREMPSLSKKGFRNRIWPNARAKAGLPKTARAGRKPKSVP
jgi:hypothetical protein